MRDFCLQNRLLCPGQPLRLAAAVSGGADSMALLLLLRALQPEFGYTLSACHVNHGLRGGAADRDEAFMRRRPTPGRTGPAACAMPALNACAKRG